MENQNFYISPYGNKRKQNSGEFTSFLLQFVLGAFITAAILCAIALYV